MKVLNEMIEFVNENFEVIKIKFSSDEREMINELDDNLFFDEDIILPFFAGEMFAGTNINLSKFSDSIIV